MARWSGMYAFAVCVFLSSHVQAGPIYHSGTLSFQSSGQSMWDSGTAFRMEDSLFVGTQWTNKTTTIGGIVGSANAVVIPAIGAQYITIFEPRIWIPTPTWSDPLKGYYAGCGCSKDVQITPAIGAITADTRTGAELNVHTSGKAGIEFGYAIDSGSIDSASIFQAMAELPDTVLASEFFNLNTSSIFDSGSIDTQSPKIEAYASAIMQLTGSIDARICALTLGCANSSPLALPDIDMDQRIVSIDPNSVKILDGILPDGKAFAEIPIGNLELELEGGATLVPPVVGFKLSGPGGITIASSLPPTPSLEVDIAELSLTIPDIATSGSGSDSPVTSSGRDDLLSLQVDLDGALSLITGVPVGLEFTLIDKGPFEFKISLDLFDADAGPVLGVTQNFEFIPTLMVDIEFSNPVRIADKTGLHSSWSGLWSSLPSFAILGTTTFTPTFWVNALVTNTLGLDLGLTGTLDVLKLEAEATIAGLELLKFNELALNHLMGLSNSPFEAPKLQFPVYEKTFSLGGFNSLKGKSFTLTTSAAVPEPEITLLLLAGLLALVLQRHGRLTRSRDGEHLRA